MSLTAERVYAALAPRPVRFYEQVDSTNDIALAWMQAGAPTGSAVIADEQVKGRGRLGRTWYTPPGTALILSVILRPPAEALPQVSMLGAVTVCELVEHCGAREVGIKWPNDVQLKGRKVAGVLPEAVWRGEHLVGVVLGMGINVRIEFTGTALAESAASIEPVVGKRLDRLALLVYLLERVDYWATRLGTAALLEAWKMRLTTLGQTVTFENGESGVAEAVDERGTLLVRRPDGTLYRAVAGDIALGSG